MPNDERFENALRDLPRVKPARDLSARILATLPQTHPATHERWLGVLMMGAAFLGIVLAYQTAFDMSMRGAFDLLAYYTAQPAIVAMYPREAFGALAQAIPWLTAMLSACALGTALILVYRLTAQVRAGFWQRA